MATAQKQAQQLAKQLFRLSLVNGEVSAERVAGVLEYVEKHRPAHPHAVLSAYRRLIATELARSEAVVEHAGAIPPATLDAIAANLARKTSRKVTITTKRNDALLAGVRIRLGDDLYESSVAGQLQTLSDAAS
jgi:F-type H+-transporting ATPase subunit delta